MLFQIFFIYLMIFTLALGLINTLNGFINKTFYHGMFKFTGRSASIQAFLSIAGIILVVVSIVGVFPEALKEVNPFLATALFILPLIFYKRILNFSENYYKYYQKPKNTRVNWGRAFLLALLIVVGAIVSSFAVYLAFGR